MTDLSQDLAKPKVRLETFSDFLKSRAHFIRELILAINQSKRGQKVCEEYTGEAYLTFNGFIKTLRNDECHFLPRVLNVSQTTYQEVRIHILNYHPSAPRKDLPGFYTTSFQQLVELAINSESVPFDEDTLLLN